jgi:tRNA (uracil-5-)-methyltransferase TRM9
MDSNTCQHLIELNHRFYSEFGAAFAATRRRIQEGVRRALGELPDHPGERWLDLGCGSGALAVEWLKHGRQSSYLGLDFSGPLLAEARQAVEDLGGAGQAAFALADLGSPTWADGLEGGFRGALAFAVLHHLPSLELRLRILSQVRELLAPGGAFVHSVWQFHRSEKLLARVQPWSAAGLEDSQLDPGDTLLDWRYSLPGQAEQIGLRYVHRFTRAELGDLAAKAGFLVIDEYVSDGQGGQLGLYQTWKKV